MSGYYNTIKRFNKPRTTDMMAFIVYAVKTKPLIYCSKIPCSQIHSAVTHTHTQRESKWPLMHSV